MKKQIIILEEFESEDRKKHWDIAESKFANDYIFNQLTDEDKIILYIDSHESTDELPFIVFAHNSDITRIRKRGKLILNCKNNNVPLVVYSGATDNHILRGLLLEDLYVSVLAENLDSFLNDVKNLTHLTSDDIGKLVDLDPELESLLKNLVTVSPFDFNPELISSKEKLQKRVNRIIQNKR